MLRRGKNKQPKTIDQYSFIESVNELLAKAKEPQTALQTSVENAKAVNEKLAAITAGKLAVSPPLSHEQASSFYDEAAIIIGIGEKALGSLSATTEARQATEVAGVGTGQGSEAKA